MTDFFWPAGSSGGGSGSNASVGPTNTTAPTNATEVGFVDSSGNLQPFSGTNAASGPNVVVTSSPLPTGAATSANQTTQETTLSAIQANQTNGTQTTNIAGTVPLPTGAATSALQTTGNTSLASIATNTPPLGAAVTASSSPVNIASDQIVSVVQNNILTSGTLTAVNQAVIVPFNNTASGSVTLTGTWVGTVAFQLLNSAGVYGAATIFYPGTIGTPAATTTSNGSWSFPTYGYMGMRVLMQAYTSGTVNVAVLTTPAPSIIKVVQDNAANFNTTVTGTVTMSNQYVLTDVTVTDIASAAITTTTTSSTIVPVTSALYSTTIQVSAVSGTNPTMVVQIQESMDSGTTWFTTFTFPVITATGAYYSPMVPYNGNRIRYVQTITGSTPSFTRTLIRNTFTAPTSTYVQGTSSTFADRSGSTSATPSTSTQVAPYNPYRRYFIIQNLSPTAYIYMNFTSVANTTSSLQIVPLGSYVMESTAISTEAINILSATASVPFVAKEG